MSIQEPEQLDSFYIWFGGRKRRVLVTQPRNLFDVFELQLTDDPDNIVTVLLTQEEIEKSMVVS